MLHFYVFNITHRVQERVNQSPDKKVIVVRSRSFRFAWVCENCSDAKTKHYAHGQHSANPNHNSPGSVPGLIIHGYRQAGCPSTSSRNQGYTRVAKRSRICVSKYWIRSLIVNKHNPKIRAEPKWPLHGY